MSTEPAPRPAIGLLSLSAAAASAAPIPISPRDPPTPSHGPAHSRTHSQGGLGASAAHHKPRRLSSAGQRNRRLSDARDAASRPSSASALAALASLTLSTSVSPPPNASLPLAIPRASSESTQRAIASSVPADAADGGIPKPGKKRGHIYKCESCSKMYRHPSCLIKHRWEHAPQWRTASKFLLSKHQQVQLLEAAAILSHIAPPPPNTNVGADTRFSSLPEDRSLWPSFVSGGVVPLPSGVPVGSVGLDLDDEAVGGMDMSIEDDEVVDVDIAIDVDADAEDDARSSAASVSVSASLPRASTRRTSTPLSSARHPRMHNYALPTAQVTQLRPGVFGVPSTAAPAIAVVTRESSGVSINVHRDDDDDVHGLAHLANIAQAEAKSVPQSIPRPGSAYHHHAHSYTRFNGFPSSAFTPTSLSVSGASASVGGWSLPSSSARSSSRSRSRSGSAEADADMDAYAAHVASSPYTGSYDDREGSRRYVARPRAYSATLRGSAMPKTGAEMGVFEVEEEEEEEMHYHHHPHHGGYEHGYALRKHDLAPQQEQQEWDGMDMDMEM